MNLKYLLAFEQQNYQVQDNDKVKTDYQYLVVEWIRGPLYIF